MALRDYKYDNEKVVPLRPQATYEEYQAPEEEGQELSEILFFVNIAIFAITSVLTIFILSALKVNTLLSFTIGIAVGVMALQTSRKTVQKFIEN